MKVYKNKDSKLKGKKKMFALERGRKIKIVASKKNTKKKENN